MASEEDAKKVMLSCVQEDEKVQPALRQAAWQMEDTMDEKEDRPNQYPGEYEARELFFEVRHAEKHYTRALMCMVVLTIFETPTWCDTNNTFTFDDPHHSCLVYQEPTPEWPDGKPIEVMLSGITYLPPGYSIIFEVAILGVLFRKLWLKRKLEMEYFRPLGEQYYQLSKIQFSMSMIVVSLVDCIIFALIRPKIRVAFLCRTALFCMMPSVIKLCKCIGEILVEVATVAVFFVGFLFFFAWVSVMIFNGVDQPPEHFSAFGRAFYGLFVAGVCDEFTDILLQSYTTYRWSGILWFIFLLVVHLLFLSLVLDTLCAGYMKSEADSSAATIEDKACGVLRTFEILNEATCSEKHKIYRKTFMLFLEEYTKSPAIAGSLRVTKEYAEIAFDFVDRNKDDAIDENEFAEIAALTNYSMWTTTRESCAKDLLYGNPRVGDLINWLRVNDQEGPFEHLMNIVLGVNFVLVVIETTYDLNKWPEPPWTAWLEFVFSFIYLGECSFKIAVSGWDFYRSSPSNIFDFGTTMLLLSTSVFESLLGSLSTYANILRLFRLLRVVKQMKKLHAVQFMASTVVNLVVKSQEMLTLLSVVIYGFTVISVQLFGGLLYKENPQLEGTDYEEAKEYVLNFNDNLMAFGLWFVALLCEYKPSFAAAINRTSNIPKAWLICGLFWAIAVCITFELVKAFTIEVYMDLKDKWDNKKRDGEVVLDVLAEIEKETDRAGMKFWWKCLAVDEDEYDEVRESVEQKVEEELSGGEAEGAKKEKKKNKD